LQRYPVPPNTDPHADMTALTTNNQAPPVALKGYGQEESHREFLIFVGFAEFNNEMNVSLCQTARSQTFPPVFNAVFT